MSEVEEPQARVVEVEYSGNVLLKMVECPACFALVLADALAKHMSGHQWERTRSALIG